MIEQIFKNIFNLIVLIILAPLILIVLVLLVPFLVVGFLVIEFRFLKDRIKTKSLLKENEGKVYFIYADYNQIELSDYILKQHENIQCLKVVDNRVHGLLESFLIRDNVRKSYPRLTKISNGKLVHKEHYNSFKNYVKKNDDLEGFYELLDKSIYNLKK